MVNLRQIASSVLLVVLIGYPAMACFAPEATMTAVERQCCKMMAHQCGAMKMPKAQNCCQTDVQRPHAMAHSASVQVAPPAISADVVVSSSVSASQDAIALLLEQVHSPPESPPDSFSILRI